MAWLRTPLPFPKPKTPEPPVPGATQGSRVIFGIGIRAPTHYLRCLRRTLGVASSEPNTSRSHRLLIVLDQYRFDYCRESETVS